MVQKGENIQLHGQECLVDVRRQRMERLVQDDRKATVPQINTCYIQGRQDSVSEYTTLESLKKLGYTP